MPDLHHWLVAAPFHVVALGLLLENVLLFGLALGFGAVVVRLAAGRRITPPAPPLTRTELGYALTCVLLNTAVTVVGLWLYRAGRLTIRGDTGWAVPVDVVALTLLMDAGMYALHRVAHQPWLYPRLHAPHHRYRHPRPLTLFVLHPLEVCGFGGLWLAVLWAYGPSWAGMILYLALNVAFGVIGHLGVEPLPTHWLKSPVGRLMGTSSFHAGHHLREATNFGFYTALWDRLFGTLGQAGD